MKIPHATRQSVRRLLPITACLIAAPGLWAQAVSTPTAPAAPSTTSGVASPATSSTSDDVVELNPFVVEAVEDGKYEATRTMSGTRLNSKLEDLAASITVVTKQQLLDTAAIDINDIFLTEASTEGTYQFTSFDTSRGYEDTVALNPQAANRVRGVSAANVAVGNFATSGSIPIDTYNIDAVEISRGPNSNIFGLGEAGGSINVVSARANMSRDTTRFVTRADSYGGYRGEFDFNRAIIKDTLAVRFSGVYERKGYVREPNYDKTNRYQFAVTVRPFRNTTLRATYEVYRNFASRPNSVTPQDGITEWQEYGSPVWNPLTYSWRYLNGTTYTQVAQNQEGTRLPVGINPEFSNMWNRPSMYVGENGKDFMMINRMPNASGNHPGNASGQPRLATAGTILMRGGGTMIFPDGTSQTVTGTPLFKPVGVTDSSIYDWENINFAAPNYGIRNAGTTSVELEQWIINDSRQVLAVQAGYFREDVDDLSRNFVSQSDGAPPVIRVDINEYLLNGQANPYFLQPYVAGSEPQVFSRPSENESYRATVAYQLDFTGNDGLVKWLGRHRFAGYGESRKTISVTNGFRGRDFMVSDHSFMTPAELSNVPGRGAWARQYVRYYMGGRIDESGAITDFAPRRPDLGHVDYTWYNAVTGQWITEDAVFDQVHFSTQNLEYKRNDTKGLVWQGFLLNEYIVPTLGWRDDRLKTKGADPDVVTDPTRNIFEPSYTFDTRAWQHFSGRTTTKGVVVKSPWIKSLGLSLHYNESNSFQPEGAAYTIFQELLKNPVGDGKDYGFSVSLFEGKVSARFNKYETVTRYSRRGAISGANATRPLRMDFDTSGSGIVGLGGDPDLEDSAIGWIMTERFGPGWNWDTQTPEVQQSVVDEVWERYMGPGIDQSYAEWVRAGGVTIADVNTVTSTGLEMEVNYNPSRNWTLKANATQQKAVDTDLSGNFLRYLAIREPHWRSITIPANLTILDGNGNVVPAPYAGQPWFTSPTGVSGTGARPDSFYWPNVIGTNALAIANAGKPRAQVREWRFNLTTRYRLAGLGFENFLKNVTVGGTVRWEDKAVIGFQGQEPPPLPADQRILLLDPNKPVYDKARYYADLMFSYSFRMFGDKVRTNLQLNVRNAFESGRLQAVAVNPDGTPWNYRIIDPRQFILTASFDL